MNLAQRAETCKHSTGHAGMVPRMELMELARQQENKV